MQADTASQSTIRNAVEGVEEALYWHTVGVLTSSGTGIGTAAAIRWNKHCLFVTANHVISDTADTDLRFYFRPSGTMKRAIWSSLPAPIPSGVGFTPPTAVMSFDRFVARNVDLAALIVSPTLEDQVNVKFHDLAASPKLPRPMREPVQAIGYPSDSLKLFSPSSPTVAACSIFGSLDLTWRPQDFKPRRDLLLKFPGANEGVHPGGFSGAGVWYHKPTPKPRVWSPNLALAGIVTHYYKGHARLLILRVEKIVGFLNKIAPG
jgi:hypothetical protein